MTDGIEAALDRPCSHQLQRPWKPVNLRDREINRAGEGGRGVLLFLLYVVCMQRECEMDDMNDMRNLGMVDGVVATLPRCRVLCGTKIFFFGGGGGGFVVGCSFLTVRYRGLGGISAACAALAVPNLTRTGELFRQGPVPQLTESSANACFCWSP